jgi:RNA-directed DNA polymerase
MASTLKGRRQLLYLWQKQKGICPICAERISKITGWHNHHVMALSRGGAEGAENRVLLHPNCHMQVHNRAFKVVLPRPLQDECEA